MPLLRLPEPYDFALSTERYRSFGPDLANLWLDGGLHRVVGGREVRIEAAPGGVRVEPLDPAHADEIHRLLGGGFDLAAFARFAAEADGLLSRMTTELAGFRPPLAPDPFESLVTSITAQQVSLRAALAIRNRLLERFGERAGRAYAFPRAERLAAAAPEELVALGFSRRKAEYVVGLARSGLDLAALAEAPDGEVKERLVAVRGLGEWTADWFLARHLGRPRAWPAGDLGLRKAVAAFYFGGRSLATAEVRAFGERFAPFENLAAHYLLTGLRVAAVRAACTAGPGEGDRGGRLGAPCHARSRGGAAGKAGTASWAASQATLGPAAPGQVGRGLQAASQATLGPAAPGQVGRGLQAASQATPWRGRHGRR